MRRLQGGIYWQAFVWEEEGGLAIEAERRENTLYQQHCCGCERVRRRPETAGRAKCGSDTRVTCAQDTLFFPKKSFFGV